MKNKDIVENIIPQSHLSHQAEGEFMTAEQMIVMAQTNLEFLKAMYRQQLGYDLAVNAIVA
ncbi:hypothetical protein [Rufibacter roseolus]|uniref:hypothetical protein n=1 Tax=Rufibacter roseolus TaxID=2817375 RepID=UPI001B318419|nr:hypothetical protein [Rufibacter roseolus]